MEFSNRNVQSQAAAPGAQPTAAGSPSVGVRKSRPASDNNGKWGRIGFVAAVAVVVLLIVGVILLTVNSSSDNEDKYVNTSKLQAVFLNTGQVYFGNIKTLNDKYFVLTNIYYLQTSSGSSTTSTTSANTSVSLVKLGCELHQPYDQMVINRDQVTFWENLQSSGQVAQAVATFQKQNPNGQKCADQSSSASTSSVNSTQNAGTSTTPSTGSSTGTSTDTTNP
jgi:hypothetical protein